MCVNKLAIVSLPVLTLKGLICFSSFSILVILEQLVVNGTRICDSTALTLEAVILEDISLMTTFVCLRTSLCSFGVVFLLSNVSVLLEVVSP
jgi:hypothetical protein